MTEYVPPVCEVRPAVAQTIHDLTIVALSKSFSFRDDFDASDAKRIKAEYDRIYSLIGETFPDVD